jgi:hypothetical protein
MTETFEQLEIEVVREGRVGFSGSFSPNCDPGRFDVMLNVMKLQSLVIAAYSLWKKQHSH